MESIIKVVFFSSESGSFVDFCKLNHNNLFSYLKHQFMITSKLATLSVSLHPHVTVVK